LFWLAVCGGETMNYRVGIHQALPRTMRYGVKFTNGQTTLLMLLIGLGSALLLTTLQVAVFNTLLIFLFVAFVGLQQCQSTTKKMGDPKLQLLATFWLIKLGMTLFLLYAGWIPELDSSSVSWGYDPQRFYVDAQDLIDNNWTPAVSSNYQGIIYYYGVMFYLFGQNPVIPALINAFATLLGTLYLIRLAYQFKGVRSPYDWTLALLLLIPELLWYDVMTSRETLMGLLILTACLTAGRYLVNPNKVSVISTLIYTSASLGAILFIRTSMVIPVVAAITLMIMLLKTQGRLASSGFLPKLLIVVLALTLLAMGPLAQQFAGGSDINFSATIDSVGGQNSEERMEAFTEGWSENSIGKLLIPDNAWQALLYLPPRMVLYLAAPLPRINVTISDLWAGSWSAWQSLFTIPTSVLNLLMLPYAMAGFRLAWKQRRQRPAPLVLHFTFWIVFMGVAGGNAIIHERYRVMMELLLFACVWLGYTSCTPKQLLRFAYPWFGLLTAAAGFYTIYKIF